MQRGETAEEEKLERNEETEVNGVDEMSDGEGDENECPGCNVIKDNKRAQAHSDRCRMRIEECLRTTPHGTERLDRRSEVVNESLAGEKH